MATAFPPPVTAVQVGSYFVGQYYQVLQQQPDLVHQFYTDASTMIRIDGNNNESASAMVQIHSLIMALSFTGIEIKTAHSLDSWNGGVLVMVSGSVQTKEYVGRRKFAQTFFLAPQEKGYFVLNDIFHFLEEEPIHEQPAAILTQNHFDSKVDASSQYLEPDVSVSDYVQGEEPQSREFVAPTHVEENDIVDQYSPSEVHQEQLPEHEEVEETPVEETPVEESTPQYGSEINTVQDPPPAPVEEPIVEPTKHTYASILRAKAQPTLPVAPQKTVKKSVQPASDWNNAPQASQQAYPALATSERSGSGAVEEASTFEEEGDGRSVYVRNLSSTTTTSEIEEEFKNFGRIKPEGVVIRNRKDVGVWFAFVEFEEVSGAQNAIQASPVQLSGRPVYIVERRPNSSTSFTRGGRGRGGGRGRVGYQTEAPRGGRFGGRSYGGRGNGQDGDYNYNRPSRGNGFQQQRSGRQDKGILGNQAASKNEQSTWN